MEGKKDQYLKVNDYDLKGNRENFRVFLGRITQSPWKAFLGAILFVSLGMLLLVSPSGESAKFSNEWSVWIPAGLALGVAIAFLIIGIWAISKPKKG